MDKIALLLPDFEEGGMPAVASNLLSSLRDYYNVDIILIKSNRKVRFNTFNSHIVELEQVSSNKIIRYIHKISSLKTLKKIRKRNKYKAIISYGILAGFLNIFTKSDKSKAICTIHNISSIENASLGISGKIFNLFLKYVFPKANKVVGISQGISQDLISNYDLSNVETIYNPYIFKDNLLLNNRVNHSDSNHVKFMTAARLEKSKGLDKQIFALSKLRKEGYLVTLDIYGEGSQKDYLGKLINKLCLNDYVFLKGFSSNLNVEMQSHDFFLFSSKYEGFGNVLIESLINKTPIISEDILSGPREVLNGLDKVNYSESLKRPVEQFNNGILCINIYNGMKVALLERKKYNINIDILNKKLNPKHIAKIYKKIITENK